MLLPRVPTRVAHQAGSSIWPLCSRPSAFTSTSCPPSGSTFRPDQVASMIAQAASETRGSEPQGCPLLARRRLSVLVRVCVWVMLSRSMDRASCGSEISSCPPTITSDKLSNPGQVRARSPAFPRQLVQVQVLACPSPTAHPLPQTTLLHISAKRVSRKTPGIGGGRGGGGRSIRGVGYLSFAPLHFPIFRGRPTASFIGPRGKVPRHESRPRVGGLQPHQKKPSAFGT